VKIHAVPIEAYRQTAGITAQKNQAAPQEQSRAKRPDRPEKVTITGGLDRAVPSVQAPVSPPLLEGVLTAEEKDMLLKHFARFGDAGEQSHIYGTGARAEAAGPGIKVDLKA
jgi:hypothetical protein